MNNLKIKSYSLKKGTNSSTLGQSLGIQYLTERKIIPEAKSPNITEKETNKNTSNNVPANILNEVNRIIKTPGLNVSSKLDSKGINNYLIYL